MPPSSRNLDVSALLPVPPRDYLILLALVDGPLHGHGLLRAVEQSAGGVLFDTANLYRLLRKLERDELVSEVRSPAKSDGRRRREYALTALGRAVVVAESGRLAALTDAARARKLVPSRSGSR